MIVTRRESRRSKSRISAISNQTTRIYFHPAFPILRHKNVAKINKPVFYVFSYVLADQRCWYLYSDLELTKKNRHSVSLSLSLSLFFPIRSGAISSTALFNRGDLYGLATLCTPWKNNTSSENEREGDRKRERGNYYGLKNRNILRSVKHSPSWPQNPPLPVPQQWIGLTRCPRCQLALVSYGWPCRLARYFPPLLSSRFQVPEEGLLLERERRSVFTASFSFSTFYTYLHPLRDYSLHDVAE